MADLNRDILLVDDERSMREFLAIHLKRAGRRDPRERAWTG